MRQPRPPSLLDALAPIVVLIGLLALTIALFGVSATDGPLQVALLLSAAFASLVAFKNGYSVESVGQAAVTGVTAAMSAVFILLAVGALIGTWNMAGTIPTVVDLGIRLVSPTWFYFTAAVVCAVVGMVTGSSWTTAGTLGVAFVGMSTVLGLDQAIAAGAVICGAYFGDKMTPLSETTILVPRLVGGGLTVGTHVRNMVWTAGPALAVSLVIFYFLGRSAVADASVSVDEVRAELAKAFDISALNLLPLVLLVVFAVMKMPPFLSILGSAVFAAVLAPFLQWDAVVAFVDDPSLGPVATSVEGRVRRDGDRLREPLGRAADRRPVLPGRHGQHAHDDLAGARRAVVRRRDGARRLPAAPARTGRGQGEAARGPDRRRSTPAASASTSSPATSTSRTCCRRARSARSSRAAGWRPRCSAAPSRTPAPSPHR